MIKNIKKKISCLKGFAEIQFKEKQYQTIKPRFLVNNTIEAEKIIEKDFEEELLLTYLSEIEPGDIIYDIGANIGLYTLPSVVRLNGKGKVYAFEPAPLWFQRLQENIEFNHLNPQSVLPINVGFSNKREKCNLVMKDVQGSGMGSVTDEYDKALSKESTISVPLQLVKGDDFLIQEEIPFPNIVKIDVEGSEAKVITGLEIALKNSSCRFILCEVHPQYMPEDPETINRILKNYGFELQINRFRKSEYHILGRK